MGKSSNAHRFFECPIDDPQELASQARLLMCPECSVSLELLIHGTMPTICGQLAFTSQVANIVPYHDIFAVAGITTGLPTVELIRRPSTTTS